VVYQLDNCKHAFCPKINTYLNQYDQRCPNCRNEDIRRTKNPPDLVELRQQLELKCQRDLTCDWIGLYEHYQHHLAQHDKIDTELRDQSMINEANDIMKSPENQNMQEDIKKIEK
jgi:hypothetical protein